MNAKAIWDLDTGLASDLQGKGLRKELIQAAAVCVSWLLSDQFEGEL